MFYFPSHNVQRVQVLFLQLQNSSCLKLKHKSIFSLWPIYKNRNPIFSPTFQICFNIWGESQSPGGWAPFTCLRIQLLSDTLQKYFFMCGRHGSTAFVVMETKKEQTQGWIVSIFPRRFVSESGLCASGVRESCSGVWGTSWSEGPDLVFHQDPSGSGLNRVHQKPEALQILQQTVLYI